jgi:hypothetical protein
VYRPSTGQFFLQGSPSSDTATIELVFGWVSPTLRPVAGDWNGDGIDTIGLYDQGTGTFYLRDHNTTGYADYAFGFGIPGDIPIAGRWSQDMTHAGVGVYRSSIGTAFLKKELSSGPPDFTVHFGNPGDIGLAGDWNGGGLASPGLYRPSANLFFLTNTVCTSCAVYADDYAAIQNLAGLDPPGTTYLPLVGNWAGRSDSIALYGSNGWFNMKRQIVSGPPDVRFQLGLPGDIPIAGHWTGSMCPLPSADLGTCGVPTGTCVDGVPAFSNGAPWVYHHQACTGDGYRYTSAEFANRYLASLGPYHVYGDVSQWCNGGNSSGQLDIWMGSTGYAPVKGDIVVWSTVNTPHAAVVAQPGTSRTTLVEQDGAWAGYNHGVSFIDYDPTNGWMGYLDETPYSSGTWTVDCFLHVPSNKPTPNWSPVDCAAASGGKNGSGNDPSDSCPCQPNDPSFNNFCFYAPNTAGCPMTAGGYCDGSEAGWEKGYYAYLEKCGAPKPQWCATGCYVTALGRATDNPSAPECGVAGYKYSGTETGPEPTCWKCGAPDPYLGSRQAGSWFGGNSMSSADCQNQSLP